MHDRIDAAVAAMRASGGPGRWAALLGLLLALALVHVTAPGVLVNDAPLDVFVPLDAGYRVWLGQTPHVDFHTPIGPLHTWTYGALLRLVGLDARVVLYGSAAWSLVAAAVALWAARDRLPPGLQAAVATLTGILVLTPRNLDSAGIGHIASYNRIGAALAGAVLLAAAVPPDRRRSAARDLVDGSVAVGVVVALCFVKVTYFALAGAGLVLAVALVPANRRWAFGAGAATWGVLGVLALVSEIPAAYLADVRMTASAWDPVLDAATSGRAPGVGKLTADLRANLATLCVVLGVALYLARTERAGESGLVLRAVGAMCGSAVLVLAVNVQTHDLHAGALLGVAAAAVGWLLHRAEARGGDRTDRRAALVATVAVLLAAAPPGLVRANAVIRHHVAARTPEMIPASDDPTSPARTLLFPGGGGESRLALILDGTVTPEVYERLVDGTPRPSELRTLLDEAAALARQADGPVFTTTFSQFVPFLTGGPAHRGGLGWYHAGRTFGGDSPLDPEVLLADVALVLVPTTLTDPNQRIIGETVEAWLAGRWERVDHPLWRVYRRPTP